MKITVEVVDLWDAPDAVRQYLETGDETLRAAARAAAWAAAARAAATAAATAACDAARGDTRVHRLKEMINEQ